MRMNRYGTPQMSEMAAKASQARRVTSEDDTGPAATAMPPARPRASARLCEWVHGLAPGVLGYGPHMPKIPTMLHAAGDYARRRPAARRPEAAADPRPPRPGRSPSAPARRCSPSARSPTTSSASAAAVPMAGAPADRRRRRRPADRRRAGPARPARHEAAGLAAVRRRRRRRDRRRGAHRARAQAPPRLAGRHRAHGRRATGAPSVAAGPSAGAPAAAAPPVAPPPVETPGPSVTPPAERRVRYRAPRADRRAIWPVPAATRPATTWSPARRRPPRPRPPGSVAPCRARSSDPALDPVFQAGGGEQDGWEMAEAELIENATHGDGRGNPERDAFTPEAESDRATGRLRRGGSGDLQRDPGRSGNLGDRLDL